MTVTVKKIGPNEYEAWKVTPQDVGNTYDPINTSHISEPIPYGQSVDAWAAELDWDELEAALIIFTDRWTWDNGQREDKVCLEALEREKERREEQENWLHAGSHVHAINMHGPVPTNPTEGMMHVDSNGRVMVFNSGQWCPVSISSQHTISNAGSHTHSFGMTPTPFAKPPKSTP